LKVIKGLIFALAIVLIVSFVLYQPVKQQIEQQVKNILSELENQSSQAENTVSKATSKEESFEQELTPQQKIVSTQVTIDYGRDQLTNTQKNAYNALSNGIRDLKKEIPINALSEKDADKVFRCYLVDHPTTFWLPSNYSYTLSSFGGNEKVTGFTFNYGFSKTQVETMKKEAEQAAKSMINGLAKKSQYDKVQLIHDRLVSSVKYDSKAKYRYDVYGALVKKRIVCEGYAKAMQYLLSLVGIESITVTGYAGENHMWNVVKIDGQYYHLDATFDDPVIESRPQGLISYRYFNITTAQIQKTHKMDKMAYSVPTCTATKANYYVKNNLLFEKYNQSTISRLVQAGNKAVSSKESTVQIRFTTNGQAKTAMNDLVSNGKMYDVLKQMKGKVNRNKFSYLSLDENNVVEIILVYS
jgi:transglutaminase/protease-like cytokinesis protein 3